MSNIFSRSKGFVFSIEAIIALLIFASISLTLFQSNNFSFKEIVVLQQENDLLKVWSVEYPSISEAVKDCETMFGKNFDLRINGFEVHKSLLNKESVSSSAIILDDSLSEKKFEIIVYFE